MIMTAILKALNFVNLPARSRDPVTFRRERLIERLEEQKVLVKSPSFLRTTTRFVGKGDARHSVERTQRVRPWWRNDAAGNLVMTVQHASRQLELAPGKTGVLTSKDKLPALIDQLIAAAKAGEFDLIEGGQAVPEAQAGGSRVEEQGARCRDSRVALSEQGSAHTEREPAFSFVGSPGRDKIAKR
jgi:hypothetical protein